MTALDTPAASPRIRTARALTDGLEPRNIIIVVLVLIGIGNHGLAGLGWAALAALFAGILPMVFIRYGMRRGRWGDRHVGQRQQRLIVIPVIMALVAVGCALMWALNAPADMIAAVAAMFATLIPLLAVTVLWKVSVHTSVSSGASAMLVCAFGPWWLLGYPAVAAIGWSRVALRDHTPAQTVAGAVLGAAVAGLTFGTLR